MPSFSKTNRLKIAFKLNEDSLLELHKLLNGINSEEPKYSLVFKDGKRSYGLDLKNVLSQSNVKGSTITRLSSNKSHSGDDNLQIDFWNSAYSPIEYRLEVKEERNLLHYEQKVNEYCESLKPMYSFIAVSYFLQFLFLFFPIIFIVSNINYRILGYFKIIDLDIPFSVVVMPVLTGIFGWILPKYVDRIFPAGEFEIGNGIKRSENRSWIRNSVIGVLVLGTLGSALQAMIFN